MDTISAEWKIIGAVIVTFVLGQIIHYMSHQPDVPHGKYRSSYFFTGMFYLLVGFCLGATLSARSEKVRDNTNYILGKVCTPAQLPAPDRSLIKQDANIPGSFTLSPAPHAAQWAVEYENGTTPELVHNNVYIAKAGVRWVRFYLIKGGFEPSVGEVFITK